MCVTVFLRQNKRKYSEILLRVDFNAFKERVTAYKFAHAHT